MINYSIIISHIINQFVLISFNIAQMAEYEDDLDLLEVHSLNSTSIESNTKQSFRKIGLYSIACDIYLSHN